MDKPKKRYRGSILVFFAALAVICFALSKLIPILWDYRGSQKTYEKLETYVTEDSPSGSGSAGEDAGDETWEQTEINFSELKKENSDIIAWIRFDDPGEVAVNYPVLYSGDNDTYLRHDIYGDYHIAGCIFLEGSNRPDFSDYHSIVYGHNMRNSTMFGDLKKYKEQTGFYEKNQYFTIYTETKKIRFRIFSYHDVKDTSEIYTAGYLPGKEYQNFLKRLTDLSIQDCGIEPEDTDKIVTLSTCSTEGEDQRFVIHAVCVGEKRNM